MIYFEQNRKKYLEDSIKLYRFYGECDTFETWMKDKVHYYKLLYFAQLFFCQGAHFYFSISYYPIRIVWFLHECYLCKHRYFNVIRKNYSKLRKVWPQMLKLPDINLRFDQISCFCTANYLLLVAVEQLKINY